MQDPVYSMQKRGLLLVVVAACSVSPFLVFSLLEGAGFHDNQRLIEWVVVVLGCLVVAGHLAWPQRVTAGVFKPLQWPLAAFFLLGLVSSVLSYSPRHALFEWANLLALLAVALLPTTSLLVLLVVRRFLIPRLVLHGITGQTFIALASP